LVPPLVVASVGSPLDSVASAAGVSGAPADTSVAGAGSAASVAGEGSASDPGARPSQRRVASVPSMVVSLVPFSDRLAGAVHAARHAPRAQRAGAAGAGSMPAT